VEEEADEDEEDEEEAEEEDEEEAEEEAEAGSNIVEKIAMPLIPLQGQPSLNCVAKPRQYFSLFVPHFQNSVGSLPGGKLGVLVESTTGF
jgi:hypothetical protein